MTNSFKPRTAFVKAKLSRTSWEHRRIIHRLLKIESVVFARKFGRLFRYSETYLRKYPVEAELIKAEIVDGSPISIADAMNRVRAIRAEERRQRNEKEAQEASKQQRELESAYEDWISAGGLPALTDTPTSHPNN